MFRLFVCCFLFASAAFAQRTITLTWDDPHNPPATTTYNIYRVNGACTLATSGYVKVNPTPLTGLTYDDTVPGAGVYCYVATAVDNNLESHLSNQSEVVVPAAPPQSVNAAVQ